MKTWTFVDKCEWPNLGNLHTEPDKAQWVDEQTGLDCLAVRNRRLGHWCGYVGVPESHHYFGKDYDEVDADVHGGLTFADVCQENDKEHGICHIPEHGRPEKVWWLGFDCAHLNDVSPGIASALPTTDRTRTWNISRASARTWRRRSLLRLPPRPHSPLAIAHLLASLLHRLRLLLAHGAGAERAADIADVLAGCGFHRCLLISRITLIGFLVSLVTGFWLSFWTASSLRLSVGWQYMRVVSTLE